MWETNVKAIEEGFKKMKPGVIGFEVDSSARAVIVNAVMRNIRMQRVMSSDIQLMRLDLYLVQIGKIKKRQIPYLRRRLGIVFQDFKLLDDRNVFEI